MSGLLSISNPSIAESLQKYAIGISWAKFDQLNSTMNPLEHIMRK